MPELYLDLLMKTLTGLIYEDPAMDPWNGQVFDAEKRAVGGDWPSMAHTMVGVARLQNLRELTETVLAEKIPGNLIETGVWRGGCCILMKGILTAYGDPDRQVILCDSFRGLPPPREDVAPDHGDTLHQFEQLAVSRAEVAENFRRYGLLDDRVMFVEGYFEETLAGLDCGPLAILRLDGDMYSSTITALDALYDKLSPGGFVIVDDYALPTCKAAVDDFRAAHGVVAPLHHIDWSGAWWRKPSLAGSAGGIGVSAG